MNKKILFSTVVVAALGMFSVSCQRADNEEYQFTEHIETEQTEGAQDTESTEVVDNEQNPADTTNADSEDIVDHIVNDQTQDDGHDHAENADAGVSDDILALGCVKASNSQESNVNLGLSKKEKFLAKCAAETSNSSWCAQLIRPNPSSKNTFRCTYGSSQAHVLIHPNETTWKYPIAAVKVIKDLQAKGLKVSQIYNWWRPEPYNKNVGGAAGRHPYGTSVDVRFASNSTANTAFKELCKMRKAGRIRAIGHYGSASLHIGVGDKLGNTWGKYCN
ncbi:hypothetical protein ACLVWU_05760 [Bdellovibrio sp. HCB290]|uniref:hypothetical protein n=1 Tax=Bdellovibrio sp. HCB290 TaxID=3394356 RepID=UPI0039B616FA